MSEEKKKNDKAIHKPSCLISKEVLLFLEWLLLYDGKIFDNFVKKIWNRGFDSIYMEGFEGDLPLHTLDAQQTIFDFFTHLELTIEKLAKKDLSSDDVDFQRDCCHNIGAKQDDVLEDSIKNDLHEKISLSSKEHDHMKKNFYKKFLHKWNTNNIIVE